MSDDTSIDYQAVLADLKAKREKLDAAITGIETMLGLKSLDGGMQSNTNTGPEVGPGAYLGMSIVDATKKYLRAVKQPKRNEDILAALKTGGLLFTSKEPVNTVGSVLNRDWTNGGDIVRVSRGVWGLAEWNPRLRRKAGSPEPADDASTEGGA
jgi:hypothetical protein